MQVTRKVLILAMAVSTAASIAASIAASLAAAPAAPDVFWIRRDVIYAPRVEYARGADLDGDGDVDLIGVEPNSNAVRWWENRSAGTDFSVSHVVSSASAGVTVIAPGDFDGDGDIDLAGLRSNRIVLWLNDGNGAFSPQGSADNVFGVSFIDSADLNGDGRADLVTLNENASTIGWRENRGDIPVTFEDHTIARPPTTAGVTRIRVGDVDADGLVDLLTVMADEDRFHWWRQVRDAGDDVSFERVGGTLGWREDEVRDVAVADTDGDGDSDWLTLRSTPYRVFLWLQTQPGEFERQPERLEEAPGGTTWPSLDVADMDGDGDLDFIVAETNGDLCWYQNPGEGVSSPTPTESTTVTATPSATGSPTVGATTLVPSDTPTATGSPTDAPTEPGTPGTGTPSPTATDPTATGPTATDPTPTDPTPTETPGDLDFKIFLPFGVNQA